jgi:hypothetical protein
MRSIRLLTIMAVVLALPVSGLAAVAHIHACRARAAAVDGVAMSVDCCPQQRTQKHMPCEMPDKGSPCNPGKLGHGCNVTQAADRVELKSLPAVSATDTALSSVLTLPVSNSPNGLWRPPRAI